MYIVYLLLYLSIIERGQRADPIFRNVEYFKMQLYEMYGFSGAITRYNIFKTCQALLDSPSVTSPYL